MILASDKEMISGGTYLHLIDTNDLCLQDLVLCIRYVMQLVLGFKHRY